MTDPPKPETSSVDRITAPRYGTFRRIWLAGVLSNLGIVVQTVGAACAMTEMASSADEMALVRTAWMLPVMLISMPAGAIADMYDRRIVSLVALSISLCGAAVLTTLDWLHFTTPNLLLLFCFVIGSGMALMAPAWQSSVDEHVAAEALPAARRRSG